MFGEERITLFCGKLICKSSIRNDSRRRIRILAPILPLHNEFHTIDKSRSFGWGDSNRRDLFNDDCLYDSLVRRDIPTNNIVKYDVSTTTNLPKCFEKYSILARFYL